MVVFFLLAKIGLVIFTPKILKSNPYPKPNTMIGISHIVISNGKLLKYATTNPDTIRNTIPSIHV
jgi:hypothetical protein